MKRNRLITIIGVLALVAAACTGGTEDTTTTEGPPPPATTTTTSGGGGDGTTTTMSSDPLAMYGESTMADPALVEKALGPVGDVPDIVLASIARATQDLDQATIDKAMECWSNQQCDTGTGGEIVMGYADGGGHVNVWRGVTHMEAILQALTYPEIGRIITTQAFWQFDAAIHEGDFNFLIQNGVDFIIGYPDYPSFVAPKIVEAAAAGIPYIPFSGGYVGVPGEEGALTPGEDYLSVVGEDLCALGESYAEVINNGVGSGKVAVLGGTPGNILSLGWQTCLLEDFNDGIEVIGPADTMWDNATALQVVSGMLSADPDIRGYAYEYSDGLNTALQAYDTLNLPIENLTVALRTDEQTLFCTWVDLNEPTFNIWYSAGGNFQSRTAVTAAMMYLKGAEIPAEIIVPHVMRQVTADDCNPDRLHPTVSGTSLVPEVLIPLMFPDS